MRYSRVLFIDDDEDDLELFLMAMKEIAASVQCLPFTKAKLMESVNSLLNLTSSGNSLNS